MNPQKIGYVQPRDFTRLAVLVGLAVALLCSLHSCQRSREEVQDPEPASSQGTILRFVCESGDQRSYSGRVQATISSKRRGQRAAGAQIINESFHLPIACDGEVLLSESFGQDDNITITFEVTEPRALIQGFEPGIWRFSGRPRKAIVSNGIPELEVDLSSFRGVSFNEIRARAPRICLDEL